jgi:hypothetical protein
VTATDDVLASPPVFGTRRPRFNHVAMSLPADLLDEEHRRQLVDFYTRVFGFVEYDVLTEDRRRLVFGAYSHEQFMFLIADEPHMTTARLDHFGMSVGSMDELDELLARCRAYQASDDRVEIIDKHVDDYGMLRLWSFYVRFLLPLMVEVQFFEPVDQSGIAERSGA